jgi:hypothetical protein
MPNEDQQGQAALDNFLDMWVTGTTGGLRTPVLRRPARSAWSTKTCSSRRWTEFQSRGGSSRLIRTS